MAFFDLHCHPGLKTLFRPQDGTQISAWRNISPADHIIGDILESQSSLKLLMQEGNINLICITLHPPEIGMIDQFILRLSTLFFKEFLNKARLNEMVTLTSSYQQTFEQEFKNLTAAPRVEDGIDPIKKIRLLKTWGEYDETDFNTLHVVFNVEGGHTFYDQKNHVNDFNQVLQNFNRFIDKGYLTLYFTPTHLTPNEFITHAYGNKILTKGPLLPKGIGITPYGKQLINHAYSKKVLIDIKHMSLVSRRIFYKYHAEFFPNKPIIASHIGLSGISWTQFMEDIEIYKKKSYGYKIQRPKRKGTIDGTQFYPLTINLYDEDVIAILNSKGLIGISLDVRILGGKENFGEIQTDFLSHEEFELLSSGNVDEQIAAIYEQLKSGDIDNGNLMLNTINPEPQDLEDLKEAEKEMKELMVKADEQTISQNFYPHLNLVANHLIRIYQISDWAGISPPWDQICIGSDFDGLVEAVDCCKNATQFQSFANALTPVLAQASAHLNIDLGLPAAQIVDQLMFKNAKRFLAKHFS